MKTPCWLILAHLFVGLCIPVAVAREVPGGKFIELADRFASTDADKDNKLSEQEYIGNRSGSKYRTKSRREFLSMDDNGDGWLSRKEYSDAIRRGKLSPLK